MPHETPQEFSLETSHSDDFAAFQSRRAAERAAATEQAQTRRPRKPGAPEPATAKVPVDAEALEAARVAARVGERALADKKLRFAVGCATYDELAAAGKAYSEALYQYAKLKSPSRARRIPYQDVIR